jgi:inosose dehydratase
MRPPWEQRLAGAPISWGVCEVPGWGHQLSAEQVLTEMAGAGLRATEFGPDGFLPAAAAERRRMLDRYGLAAVGGFVPVVLHQAGRDPLAELDGLFSSFTAVGAGVVVLAAVSGADGYEARPTLDRAAWRTLCANLGRIAAVAESYGLLATLHPHVGTVVERYEEVSRVLDGCMIPLCLDTGHLLVGGADPLQLAREAAGRIAHVHLKDVDAGRAHRVRAGEIGYADAVRTGLYRPLGTGDAQVVEVVATLEGAGYDGWYVLEQDRVLPAPAAGEEASAGVTADIQTGLANLAAALKDLAQSEEAVA